MKKLLSMMAILLIFLLVACGGEESETNTTSTDTNETEETEEEPEEMASENTSEENVSFYASQATMATSTGEQLEPDTMLSDHIDGEYIGQVNKSGTSFYILENSKAEDVESVRLIYSGPDNDDFETVGEDVDFEVTLEK
jgi:hypothetical protein